jgi:hypothetical protein
VVLRKRGHDLRVANDERGVDALRLDELADELKRRISNDTQPGIRLSRAWDPEVQE